MKIVATIALVIAASITSAAIADTWSERVARYELFTAFGSLVRGGSVDPHWISNGRQFWYGKPVSTGHTFVLVDTRTGARTPFFDDERLTTLLRTVSGPESDLSALPFDTFTYDEDASRAMFSVGERSFALDLTSYDLTTIESAASDEETPAGAASPDGHWIVTAEDFDLWLHVSESGERTRLTNDGTADYPWTLDQLLWTTDGSRFAISRLDSRSIHKMPVVKWLPEQETVDWVPYAFSRERDAVVEFYVVDPTQKRVTSIDESGWEGEYQFLVGWRDGNTELLFLRFGPGMRSLSLMAADPSTGKTRTIVRDEQETFIEGLHYSISDGTFFYPLPDNRHFIWKSERDGWLHFYLYRYDGTLVRRLTKGEYEVDRVLGFDEKRDLVYFTAQADAGNPYDSHLYRVSLEGTGMRQLTSSGKTHEITLCADLGCFVDNSSSPSVAPASELRRLEGETITKLETADTSRLEALDWKPPEEFVVKAADGETDLYGLLFKPHDFDPTKKYPVIEVIYAGSWAPIVPRAFGRGENATLAHALAQLNFVTFVIDGRGTPGRGKAFMDVIYGQIGRYEIPDHVAALQQLAAARPWMDLDRVGVHGKSWGGYFALRAMLQAPDVYHVGIASGIVADLSTAESSAVAPYMGIAGENEEGYAHASCLTMADNLEGKLLITIATADLNTPFSQTMRMVDAFIKARKPFDLVLFPDQHHWLQGSSMTYFYDVLRNYFVEHLQGEGSSR